ncbi:hypothetical protein DMUE_2795 [Dictyocoela muelleri]|nr:hypothetical protein DMUE_2795 [Dictyocoela muelleri]
MSDPIREDAELFLVFKDKLIKELTEEMEADERWNELGELIEDGDIKQNNNKDDEEENDLQRRDDFINTINHIEEKNCSKFSNMDYQGQIHEKNIYKIDDMFPNTIDALIYKHLITNYEKCADSNSLINLHSRTNLDNFMKELAGENFLTRRKRQNRLNDQEKKISHSICEQRRKFATNSALLAISDFFKDMRGLNTKRTIFMALKTIMELFDENFRLKKEIKKRDRKE